MINLIIYAISVLFYFLAAGSLAIRYKFIIKNSDRKSLKKNEPVEAKVSEGNFVIIRIIILGFVPVINVLSSLSFIYFALIANTEKLIDLLKD